MSYDIKTIITDSSFGNLHTYRQGEKSLEARYAQLTIGRFLPDCQNLNIITFTLFSLIVPKEDSTMAAKLTLIKTRELTPASEGIDATFESKRIDLTLTLANVSSSVSALSWVFLRNVSESDNLVILRGYEPFTKLFNDAFFKKASETKTRVELEYSDDGIYPVMYELGELKAKFNACKELSEPWKAFMVHYTKATTGLVDKKVVKKATDSPATDSPAESLALGLLD